MPSWPRRTDIPRIPCGFPGPLANPSQTSSSKFIYNMPGSIFVLGDDGKLIKMRETIGAGAESLKIRLPRESPEKSRSRPRSWLAVIAHHEKPRP